MRGRVFYLRMSTDAPLDIRLTHATTGAVTYPQVRGLMFVEFAVAEAISVVEVQGIGSFEWSLTGDKA
jgi:hypothetical protein